jgi:hypothetical protein
VRGLALVSVFLRRGKWELVRRLLHEYLHTAVPQVQAGAAASASALSAASLHDLLPSRLVALYPPLPRPTLAQVTEASDLLLHCYVEVGVYLAYLLLRSLFSPSFAL